MGAGHTPSIILGSSCVLSSVLRLDIANSRLGRVCILSTGRASNNNVNAIQFSVQRNHVNDEFLKDPGTACRGYFAKFAACERGSYDL